MLIPKIPRPGGARRLRPKETANPGNPPQNGYARAKDGTRLFYSIEGKGPPLVFCYGLVCSSLHWTYQIDRFKKDHQAIWFDYRGHQNSDVPEDFSTLTIGTLAEDLKTLFDEIGIDQAVLLGHSMGVNVVLEFFKQNRKRVAGMVLANGTAKSPLETLLFGNNVMQGVFSAVHKVQEKAPKLVDLLWKLQKGNPVIQGLIGLGGFNTHLTAKEDIELYVNQVAELDPRVLLNLVQNYDHFDATPWLHEVDVPTLILAGDQDKVIPVSQQELMHQLIPGSQLEMIKHGSHCPQMDLPDLVNLKIEKFLREMNYR
jgi:non-heme chloroperoxidase